ncbi:MAG: hypothetical protein Alis3KO_40950 [Aliiglaciecola sp.]
MDRICAGLESAGVFVDDVCQGHQEEIDIPQQMVEFLSPMREAKLKLKPGKCFIDQQEVEFLGHMLSKDGLKMNARKVEKLVNCVPPKRIALI